MSVFITWANCTCFFFTALDTCLICIFSFRKAHWLLFVSKKDFFIEIILTSKKIYLRVAKVERTLIKISLKYNNEWQK